LPVKVKGKEPVIYTIQAKPKPRRPWVVANFDYLILIWGCLVLAIYIWMNP
jgi:hypothetical protein